jgi:glycosyltransferase involved in cell wall biosynthesis
MPVFTILSPTFNHEKYIGECISSALAQTFTDWEMIILDDGSTDKTGEIAAKFAREDPRINYYGQENQGIFRLAETNNKGLAMARGRYISILECDDRWEPEKLQRQFDILEARSEVVVCWGRAQALVAETLEIQTLSPEAGVNNTKLWPNRPVGTILNALYLENMIPAVTITLRRSALEAIGGFRQPAEFPTTDLPTLLDLALQGEFYFDDAILAQWRVYSNQMTKMYPIMMLNQRWKYVIGHWSACPPAIQSRLTISESDIKRHFRRRQLAAYATSGRYRLMRGEFSSARYDYLKAIFFPSLSGLAWRLRAITGYIFSLFHRDVEGFSRKLGKVSYK